MNNGTDCNKAFTEGKSQNPIINKDDETWTTERLVDELFLHLDCFIMALVEDAMTIGGEIGTCKRTNYRPGNIHARIRLRKL
jgi:hypothetical protein